MNIIATTTSSINHLDKQFEEFIINTGIKYVPRQKKSLKKISEENGVNTIIVWHQDGPILYIGEEKFFFHPSMAKNRISAYRKKGIPDLLIKAADLKKGDSFLDCTLGIGADAIVASYFSENGKITGLESSFALATTVKWGMKTYKNNITWLTNAIKKIEVINSDHKDYLLKLQDNKYDIVYFDPMFRNPLLSSQPISPIRKIANHNEIDLDTINEACRVASKRVVLKERADSNVFDKLGFKNIIENKKNSIKYGYIKT
ncbi:Protein-L-isoD(D-D) O-methyltransferase [Candidatus Syntrophocurvum alkaliphilum]|uniref:Protein-L-isoD(D-D) O-methyltransferase n=1 Tax=Candidatus Syntrophocurvum alkaliphilum TaxID=2293317 RepID=A0A6I6DEI3_9FIRM|nr:class I SAM-dependent methyltransferase [Candidatus Syntrophocurvum alkaliphilum]QGT99432.1 Protein-L-isoD(D-D) O-methyltransferase [Candidatus Syntrophocurvum alkaliphilum]